MMNAPADRHFASRVRASFNRQKAMALIGASLTAVEPGQVEVALGEVIRPGRTLTVTRGEVYSDDGKHVASMQQTLMMLSNTPDTPE